MPRNDPEPTASCYEAMAEELRQASEHCRTAALHVRSDEFHRACAHAFAACAHVRRFQRRLDEAPPLAGARAA